jgi:hypothetical protein
MSATKRKAAAPALENDDIPESLDEFRLALARKIAIILADRNELWRNCTRRACRRGRSCTTPDVHCAMAPPVDPKDARPWSEVIFEVRRAIDQRLAALGISKDDY